MTAHEHYAAAETALARAEEEAARAAGTDYNRAAEIDQHLRFAEAHTRLAAIMLPDDTGRH
jgi:hypothetical protein